MNGAAPFHTIAPKVKRNAEESVRASMNERYSIFGSGVEARGTTLLLPLFGCCGSLGYTIHLVFESRVARWADAMGARNRITNKQSPTNESCYALPKAFFQPVGSIQEQGRGYLMTSQEIQDTAYSQTQK